MKKTMLSAVLLSAAMSCGTTKSKDEVVSCPPPEPCPECVTPQVGTTGMCADLIDVLCSVDARCSDATDIVEHRKLCKLSHMGMCSDVRVDGEYSDDDVIKFYESCLPRVRTVTCEEFDSMDIPHECLTFTDNE